MSNPYDLQIQRLQGGVFLINGAKKVQIKLLKGKLVVRVGGGWVTISEYIYKYIVKKKKSTSSHYYQTYQQAQRDN